MHLEERVAAVYFLAPRILPCGHLQIFQKSQRVVARAPYWQVAALEFSRLTAAEPTARIFVQA